MMSPSETAPALRTLFIAEDSRYSLRALQRKLRRWPVPHELMVARDGQEAIEMLCPSRPEGHQSYVRPGSPIAEPAAVVPDILLLDLNMPRVSGLELLAHLRGVPRFDGVPVVILTTSNSPYDIDQAEALGVDAYLIKDTSPPEICDVLDALLTPQKPPPDARAEGI